MDSQGQTGPQGPTGRRLHIAHRRSPSELTPLMSQQLAIQQQLELLQHQQQQIMSTHQQYVNMGVLQPNQHLSPANAFGPMQGQMPNISPHGNNFQFPQQFAQQPQLNVPVNTNQTSHRRNQSALPSMMGPPPAPSSGASGSSFGDFTQQNPSGQDRENGSSRGRGGGASGGHQRRHSLALVEAKKAAEIAQQKRTTAGFQFPVPGAAAAPSTSGESDTTAPGESDDKAGQGPASGLTARAGNRSTAHGRSQSMAVGSAGGARGHNQTKSQAGFQFPTPGSGDSGLAAPTAQQDFQRRGSGTGHARNSSRNFEGNWRQQNTNNNNNGNNGQEQPTSQTFNQASAAHSNFQPGHRPRGSMNQSMGSIGSFQYAGQPQLVQLPQGQMLLQQPQMFAGGQLSQMQMQQLAIQAAQMNAQAGLGRSQHAPGGIGNNQQQQQRKTLFTPYLPQASLPALLSDGQLVAGILRVNKKNRSDAYVTTQDGTLDADIFICGSKDRNRALEGDLVAVELLDVDEVWGQKREKEEKKKRKDITDTRSSGSQSNDRRNDGGRNDDSTIVTEGGIRRRGSLRQRTSQKKNDDVEVEGQSLLLVEEEEVNDEQKPLYAGHIVAVVERVAGQMFSGTLGLLRPSSQATKEKQEAERQARDGNSGRHQPDRAQEKPKIVWFKPTDKRVPLIAIPTEQAPRDFVEKHQDYANRIFVACIKRWPITSLHPFGTLVEQLGEMGDLRVETDALLRDNNFGPDDFSDAVLRNVGFDNWSVTTENESEIASRRDFREEKTFTIDPNGAKELDDAIHVKTVDSGKVEVGVHIADVAHFIKANQLVDREAKKRGTGVYLMNRTVDMLPPKLTSEICSLSPGEDRFTVSVVFTVDIKTGAVDEDDLWIGKAIIKSSGKLAYRDVDSVLGGDESIKLEGVSVEEIKLLDSVAQKLRQVRLGAHDAAIAPLRLLYQLDDENVPVEHNIFDSSPAHELIEELAHKANTFVAKKLAAELPEKAFLRRQQSPNTRRLQTIVSRMGRIDYDIDTTSSGSLQSSLFKIEDSQIRMGMETLLIKAMQSAKYYVYGKTPEYLHPHYALNLPLYTHFTNPSRRYADIIVHRQLEAVLSKGAIEFTEDADSLVKTADQCNTKKDSAKNAQEQSVHIESCRFLDKKRQEATGDLISEAIVLCVYESAFDVLIPEYGFEKRVHCDQLPLKKAEFRKDTRILELYWEKGVPSSLYIPEDERPKAGSIHRGNNAAAAAREAAAAEQAAKEREEAQRRHMETGTMSTDDVDALFDDDDDDDDVMETANELSGVSLNPPGGSDRPTQSMPPSPTKNDRAGQRPQRTRSDPKLAVSAADAEGKVTDKERYRKYFTLREENGDYIQDVTEMTRVPVILKTDLTKSPPCLTIRSLNPYAL
ncbi:MAG: hypothetical protein M1814_004147 [Vezdaea aestivalis]|nr:MAG: hypothetical protein M1814_004147 [Vezdaea aestivalis]